VNNLLKIFEERLGALLREKRWEHRTPILSVRKNKELHLWKTYQVFPVFGNDWHDDEIAQGKSTQSPRRKPGATLTAKAGPCFLPNFDPENFGNR
jgi:hypothetical protein